MIFHAGILFPAFPALDAIIGYQTQSFIVFGVQIPVMLAILSPFSMLAFFGIMPTMYQPFQFGHAVSRKWTPEAEFTGKSLAWVKVLDIMRFTCIVSLFIDLFLAGGKITGTWWIDLIVFIVAALLISLLLASIKTKSNAWFFDKKVMGFLRVHNFLALVAFVLSLFLVSA